MNSPKLTEPHPAVLLAALLGLGLGIGGSWLYHNKPVPEPPASRYEFLSAVAVGTNVFIVRGDRLTGSAACSPVGGTGQWQHIFASDEHAAFWNFLYGSTNRESSSIHVQVAATNRPVPAAAP